MTTYDVVVIGTGTAGQTAAFEISEHGFNVAVIEQSTEPGGTCALHGCQSKKYFYEAAETVARCRHLLGKGIDDVPKPNWADVLKEKNKFTKNIPENTVKNVQSSGMDYYEGRAVFEDELTLAVGNKKIQGRFIIIATGAEPMTLPIDGGADMITSNDFLALDHLPDRIALVGGGFISFEFAHFAARLGSKPGSIHILESQKRVLGPFDSDMAEQLIAASQAEGIVVHTGVTISEMIKTNNQFKLVCGTDERFDVDLVVNGAGRRPNITHMNLEASGIPLFRKGYSSGQFNENN